MIFQNHKFYVKIKDNYDYVVNLGGHVDHTNKLKVLNSHYIGCKNLVKILINTNIKSFVQIGSGMEYGTIKSPQKESLIQKPKKIKSYYGKAKLLATNYLKKYTKKKNSLYCSQVISSFWAKTGFEQIFTNCNKLLFTK